MIRTSEGNPQFDMNLLKRNKLKLPTTTPTIKPKQQPKTQTTAPSNNPAPSKTSTTTPSNATPAQLLWHYEAPAIHNIEVCEKKI